MVLDPRPLALAVSLALAVPPALALLLIACTGQPTAERTSAVAPEGLTGQSCAVCGMIAREQPPPRGQVRHRDGTHLHFCSLGDMRAHIQAPSPHGAVTDSWVEALPAGYERADRSRAPLTWIPAEQASYVVGFERPRVMGVPALSFEMVSDATEAARRVGGRVVDWPAMRTTPAHQIPDGP